jgi:hypothetical protein
MGVVGGGGNSDRRRSSEGGNRQRLGGAARASPLSRVAGEATGGVRIRDNMTGGGVGHALA